MSRLLSKLAQLTSPEWMIRVLTLYADDFLLQCEVCCEQDLWDHLHFVGILFDLLEQAGLVMNMSKTVALFNIKGKHLRKLQSRILTQKNHKWFLVIPRLSGSASHVQLVTDIKYLGIKLSYTNYERLTLEHRLAAGRQANRRLHRWLYGKKGLDPPQRRRLWESIVRATMLYGIWATGTSSAGLKQLTAQMLTMQRMMYMNHSHRTRESHTTFFQARQLGPPLLFLHRCCLRLLEVHSAKLKSLPQDDILHSVQLHGTRTLLAHIEQHIVGGPDSIGTDNIFECRSCGRQRNTIHALLVHEGTVHGIKHGRVQVFSAARDAEGGVSICRHCQHSFPTWNALRTHIEYASCPCFDPTQVMPPSLMDIRSQLVPLVSACDPENSSWTERKRTISAVTVFFVANI